MLKKLLLALLLIPTLCFAKLGDKKEFITQEIGNPEKVYTISSRTEIDRFLYPDGETIVVVAFMDGESVAETYFSRYGREATSEAISEICRRYSDKWIPLDSSSMEDTKCVSAVGRDVRICYGPVPGTEVRYALTVLTTKGKPAFEEMMTSGLRL